MKDFYMSGHVNLTPYAPSISTGESSEICQCGGVVYDIDHKNISLVIEGKRKLSDHLMCGAYPLIVVSTKVIEAWEKYNVTGYKAFPVKKLVNVKGNEMITDMKYFNVQVTGKEVELDFEEMGVYVKNQCPICGKCEFNKEVWEFGKPIIKEDTYDGSDWFLTGYFKSPLCTKRILEITFKEKLKNFRFRSFEAFQNHTGDFSDVDLKVMFGKKH